MPENNAPKTLMIDDVKYVREDSIPKAKAEDASGLPLVIVRSQAAGVFFGAICGQPNEWAGGMVKLLNCRRLWYWAGAFTLSEIAREGVSKPSECKFSDFVDVHYVLDAKEIIPMTEKAATQIASIKSRKV